MVKGDPEYCTTCGTRLQKGEVIVCDPCWVSELTTQVSIGRENWLPDLRAAVERMDKRGQTVADHTHTVLLAASAKQPKARG